MKVGKEKIKEKISSIHDDDYYLSFDKTDSIKIQNYLFSIGYTWNDGNNKAFELIFNIIKIEGKTMYTVMYYTPSLSIPTYTIPTDNEQEEKIAKEKLKQEAINKLTDEEIAALGIKL